MARFPLSRRESEFFVLFREGGENALRAARLLSEMLDKWPDEREALAREILKAEQEGDRVTHDIIRRLNEKGGAPLDREDIYSLATKLDDVVDYVEEAADLLGLYHIDAPMAQAQELTSVLVSSCEQLAAALSELHNFGDLEARWIEIHRLENEGDRVSRDAVAALFANGIDPMVVIRWKDIFTTLERAIDSTEAAAHVIESIALKGGRRSRWWRPF